MLLSFLIAQADTSEIFGTVEAPKGVAAFNEQAGGGIGLLIFISNMIKLGTVIAGIWVLFNFIQAGFTYITSSGDSGAHKKVTDQLTMSVIGLVIIVTAYTLIAVISLLLFGKADYILNPTICGPTASEGCP